MPAIFYGKYVVEWTDPEFAKKSSEVQESNVRSANPVEAAAALQVKMEGVKTKAAEGKAAKVQPPMLLIALIAACVQEAAIQSVATRLIELHGLDGSNAAPESLCKVSPSDACLCLNPLFVST